MFQKKVTQKEFAAFKMDAQNLFEQLADIIERQAKKIETLEAKVQELEAKNVPVISDLTAGGDKPLTWPQIHDEWVNGKKEDDA